MKIKLQQLLSATQGFNNVLRAPIDPKLAYRITKITTKIVEEGKHIEKTRDDLIRKYGTQVIKDGKPSNDYRVEGDKEAEYREEMEKFLAMEVDFGAQLIFYRYTGKDKYYP